jgi:hypothetical protein
MTGPDFLFTIRSTCWRGVEERGLRVTTLVANDLTILQVNGEETMGAADQHMQIMCDEILRRTSAGK